MYFLGVDIGSLSCDAVIIDGAGKPVSWSVVPTGYRNIEIHGRGSFQDSDLIFYGTEHS